MAACPGEDRIITEHQFVVHTLFLFTYEEEEGADVLAGISITRAASFKQSLLKL